MSAHAHALDISAITDSLHEGARAAHLLALAHVHGTQADVNAAAALVEKHASRTAAVASAMQSRISAHMNRRPHP